MKNIFTCTGQYVLFRFRGSAIPKTWTLQGAFNINIDNNIVSKQADLNLLTAEVDKRRYRVFFSTLNANK
jgi:hypothetical protein